MTNKEAIEVLKDIKEHPSMSVELSEEYESLDLAIKALERPQGEWKQISPAKIYECKLCHKTVMTSDIEEYHYCHGCGAKMKGGAE